MDRSCVMQLNRLVEDDHVFRSVCGKVGRQSSMVYYMVLLKFLGIHGNEAALQKIGCMMGIYDYVTWECNASLKHCNQVIKWPKKNSETSVEELERCMVSLIVLV